jgi:phage head maturation protease
LLEHAATSPTIATTSDQTLDLWEGADGLMFRMNPPTSLAATTVLGRARRDAFAGVSIGFRLCASVFVETEGLHSCRSADLVEVSLVSKQGVGPTFAGTWVRVMSLRDSWRLEAAAKVDVAMVSSRNVSYGGLRGYLRADAVYRVDVSLARMLVSAGWATLVVR